MQFNHGELVEVLRVFYESERSLFQVYWLLQQLPKKCVRCVMNQTLS